MNDVKIQKERKRVGSVYSNVRTTFKYEKDY